MHGHSIKINKIVSLITSVLLLQSCSMFSSSGLEPDKEDFNSKTDILFKTAFCYDEKNALTRAYFSNVRCRRGNLFSLDNCDELQRAHAELVKPYLVCREAYLDDHLMVNPYHIFRK
jgi:hypothetical protein